ncbi:MAG TPA: hypothetical protein VIM73_15795, partial [Polyangiaceae bacterium]
PQSHPEPNPDSRGEAGAVDPYRELIVTDLLVVRDGRAAESLDDAPWSLRSQLRWLAGSAKDDVAFTLAWLEEWRDRTSVGEHNAPLTPRPRLDELLVLPWFSPGSSPTGANHEGSYGSSGTSSTTPPSSNWRSFPFQLIAIVNRIDLASEACSGSAGELRFVYSGIDPVAGRPPNLTLIVEVPYPQDRTPSEWAAAWHALGSLPPGESYNAELERLTRAVREGADPFSARLRTNEQALGTSTGAPWELREFRLEHREENRRLVHSPLEFTPPSNVNRTALDTHLVSHADAVLEGAVALPPELRAGAAQVTTPSFTWPASNLGESLRKAFSRETCNGCHGGDTATLPFQHIAPSTSAGAARLSRFLDAPGSENDELSRRKAALESLLEQRCDPEPTMPTY